MMHAILFQIQPFSRQTAMARENTRTEEEQQGAVHTCRVTQAVGAVQLLTDVRMYLITIPLLRASFGQATIQLQEKHGR